MGVDRAGMEELDMDEEVRPEFACPYCYEDHDVASLCAHLEEEHPFEPHAAVSLDTPAEFNRSCVCFPPLGGEEEVCASI